MCSILKIEIKFDIFIQLLILEFLYKYFLPSKNVLQMKFLIFSILFIDSVEDTMGE